MRSNLRIYGLVLLIAILFAACSKTPGGVLSEKEMQKVVTDMVLAEAMINTNPKVFTDDSAKIVLYQSVFDKHEITQALYDSSLIWYGQNLDIYMKLYERVTADLNKQVAALGDVQADAEPVSTRDSVNIWPRRPSFMLHPKAVFNGITIDIRPETYYSSGSTFVLGVNVWGLNDSLKYRPVIRLTAEQPDTVITVNDTIRTDGYHQTVLKTHATKQIRRLYGFIWMNNGQDSVGYTNIYLDNINLIRYNYGSKAFSGEDSDEDVEPIDSLSVLDPIDSLSVEVAPLNPIPQ